MAYTLEKCIQKRAKLTAQITELSALKDAMLYNRTVKLESYSNSNGMRGVTFCDSEPIFALALQEVINSISKLEKELTDLNTAISLAEEVVSKLLK